MKIIDLFAGAGGLSEGFRDDYFDIVCHVEMDFDASQTLKTRDAFHYFKKNNNLNIYERYILGEISKVKFHEFLPKSLLDKVINIEINDVNLKEIFKDIDDKLRGSNLDGIIGGPPCQAFSMIGRNANNSKKSFDKRVYLYMYYIEFLKKYKPKFFVFENVKGLLSFKDKDNNKLIPQIMKKFNESGYICEYKIILASDYGVSQNRERLFIFGYRNDLREMKFFDNLELKKEIPITVRELFKDLPKLKNGETNNSYDGIISNVKYHKYYREGDLSLIDNISRPHSKRDLAIYKIVAKAKQNNIQVNYADLPKELQSHRNKKSFTDRYKALQYDAYSHTVVAHISKDGNYYIHPDINQNRSITVREAARIQSFQDNYFFEGSRTSKFKQIGNAVPPLLSKKIAEAIKEIFKV